MYVDFALFKMKQIGSLYREEVFVEDKVGLLLESVPSSSNGAIQFGCSVLCLTVLWLFSFTTA